MKIIDLLNKIANGEEVPEKINFCRRNFEYKKDIYDYLCIDENFDKTEDYCLGVSICKWIFPSMLNDEVEILEKEKKIPEKINKIIPSQNYVISDSKNNSVDERLEIIRKRLYENELYMLDIANTLNEIIDYLKSKGE